MTTKIKLNELQPAEEMWVAYEYHEYLQQAKAKTLEKFNEVYLDTGSVRKAKKQTAEYLQGDAIFSIEVDGSFEATITSDEGLRYITGVSASPVANHVQSICRSLDNQIKRAQEVLSPKEALRDISLIWSVAEKTCELAAARSRLVLGKIPKPILGPTPTWFEDGILSIDIDNEEKSWFNPASRNSAQQIVRCITQRFPDMKAEVTVGMLGRIVLDWYNVNGRLRWMVDPIDLPFPSIKVFEARQTPGGDMHTQTLHHIYDALTSFENALNNTNGNEK